jgi:hypothetical protein
VAHTSRRGRFATHTKFVVSLLAISTNHVKPKVPTKRIWFWQLGTRQCPGRDMSNPPAELFVYGLSDWRVPQLTALFIRHTYADARKRLVTGAVYAGFTLGVYAPATLAYSRAAEYKADEYAARATDGMAAAGIQVLYTRWDEVTGAPKISFFFCVSKLHGIGKFSSDEKGLFPKFLQIFHI